MLSRLSYCLCLAVMLYSAFVDNPRYKKQGTEAAIAWDVAGYYWYLPSVFIYHDLKGQNFRDSILNKYNPTPDFQEGFKHEESGNYVMKYSSGMAVLYLPIFAIAHILAEPLGYPADGFSLPYQFSIFAGSVLFALIGMWYLRKLMLKYFSDRTVAILLLLLIFGTNYLMYSTSNAPQVHCWLFTLYVFLVLNTHFFYESNFKRKYSIQVGFLIGLLVLSRPTELIACLIPLLWGLNSIKLSAIKKRLHLYVQQWKPLAIAVTCAFAVVFIQLAYWKYASGHWLVYSYEDQGFSWLHPHTYNYMFSYMSGWLVYTPMMFLAFIGLIPLVIRYRNWVAVSAFFLLNLYIVSAWDIWWYAGTGGRAMIQSYPILLFPIAALCETAMRKRWLAISLLPFIFIFIYINFWLTFSKLYEPEAITKEFYWQAIKHWGTVPDDIHKLKDTKNVFTGIPKNMKLLYENDFENDTTIHNTLEPISGTASVYVGPDKEYSSEYSIPAGKIDGDADWIRATATFKSFSKEWTSWKMTQFIVRFKNSNGEVVDAPFIRVYRFLDYTETKDIYIDARVPQIPFDSVSVLLWNPGKEQQLLMDNLKIWAFEA